MKPRHEQRAGARPSSNHRRIPTPSDQTGRGWGEGSANQSVRRRRVPEQETGAAIIESENGPLDRTARLKKLSAARAKRQILVGMSAPADLANQHTAGTHRLRRLLCPCRPNRPPKSDGACRRRHTGWQLFEIDLLTPAHDGKKNRPAFFAAILTRKRPDPCRRLVGRGIFIVRPTDHGPGRHARRSISYSLQFPRFFSREPWPKVACVGFSAPRPH